MYPRIATDNFLFHVYMPATHQIACGRGGEMRAVIAEASVHRLEPQTICADCRAVLEDSRTPRSLITAQPADGVRHRAVLEDSRTPRSSMQIELFCAAAA